MLKGINVLTMYVADHQAAAEFYAGLGFELYAAEDGVAVVTLNGFHLQLIPISGADNQDSIFYEEAHATHKGAGLYIYVQVDEIDEYYKKIVGQGYEPSSEPSDWPWGNREFVLRDLDGYKLCFYQPLG